MPLGRLGREHEPHVERVLAARSCARPRGSALTSARPPRSAPPARAIGAQGEGAAEPLGVEHRPEARQHAVAQSRARRAITSSSDRPSASATAANGRSPIGKPPCSAFTSRRSISSIRHLGGLRHVARAALLEAAAAEQHGARQAASPAAARGLVDQRPRPCRGRGRGSCSRGCRASPAGGAGGGSTRSRRAARVRRAAGLGTRSSGTSQTTIALARIAELVVAHDDAEAADHAGRDQPAQPSITSASPSPSALAEGRVGPRDQRQARRARRGEQLPVGIGSSAHRSGNPRSSRYASTSGRSSTGSAGAVLDRGQHLTRRRSAVAAPSPRTTG